MDYPLIGSQLDREVERIKNEEHCGCCDELFSRRGGTPLRVKSFSELKKEHEAKCMFNRPYEDEGTCLRCYIRECDSFLELPF